MKFKFKRSIISRKKDSPIYDESDDYNNQDNSAGPENSESPSTSTITKLKGKFRMSSSSSRSAPNSQSMPGKKMIFRITPIIAPTIILLFVPFEQILGDQELVTRIHIGLLAITIGAGVLLFFSSRKQQQEPLSPYDEIESEDERINHSINDSSRQEESSKKKLKGINFKSLLTIIPIKRKSLFAHSTAKERPALDSISIMYNCGHNLTIPRLTIENWINQGLIPNIDISEGVLRLATVCGRCSKVT